MAAAPAPIQFNLAGLEALEQERFGVIPTIYKAIVRISAMSGKLPAIF